MRLIITIILVMSTTWLMGQTGYDKKQDIKNNGRTKELSDSLRRLYDIVKPIDESVMTLKKRVSVLEISDSTNKAKIAQQGRTIDSLKGMSNTLFFYSPAYGRDSIYNGKRIGSIIEIKK